MNANREQLAWAAGFFDGEGTFHSSQTRGAVGSRASVAQAEDRDRPGEPADVLIRFQSAIGGLGHVRPTKKQGGYRPQWIFYAGAFEDVQAIVAMLWPWLSPPKRQQAIVACIARNQWVKSLQERRSRCHRGHSDWTTHSNGRNGRRRVCKQCQNDRQREREPLRNRSGGRRYRARKRHEGKR